MALTFSVVTPCYNANRWIRSCVESVADQVGVSVQHVIQDGLSKDGTAEYLRSETRADAVIEADAGMYDAVNKAYMRATGEFVLHLNADEQLLPGALAAVGEYFTHHPDVDVVLAGALICNSDGTLNCFRRPVDPPLGILLTSHHPVQTCSIFFRRTALADRAWLYDPKFRVGSDVHLMIDLVRQKKKIGLLDRYTSAFLLTGTNLGLAQSTTAVQEYQYQLSLAPKWMTALRPAIRAMFQFRKMLAGHYKRQDVAYNIYVPGEEGTRTHFLAKDATGIYRPYAK